jgi:hypothetical protein
LAGPLADDLGWPNKFRLFGSPHVGDKIRQKTFSPLSRRSEGQTGCARLNSFIEFTSCGIPIYFFPCNFMCSMAACEVHWERCPTLVTTTESNGIGAVEAGFKISESIGRFTGGALSDCDYKLGSDT